MRKYQITYKDIRVGNVISLTEDSVNFPAPFKVGSISEERIHLMSGNEEVVSTRTGNYHGQLLTHEWLVKLGGIRTPAGRFSGADMWQGLDFWKFPTKKYGYPIEFRGGPMYLIFAGFFNTQLQYVHELQNLYYSLTKEELEWEG